MPNGWRTINSLVHKIRLHGRRGKGMAESFSRQKSRHAPQKEGGLKILCDLPARGQLNRENNIPLSPCVPENLVSRDGFSRPVPRQPAHLHTQAESGAYLRDSSRVPRRRPYETAIRHRVSPEFIGSRSCVPMAFTAESPPAQGQYTSR